MLVKDFVFIIGLPGSGKSYLLENEYKNSNGYIHFDDYHSNAINDDPNFRYSRYYPKLLLEMIKCEKNIAISDICYCDFDKFNEAYGEIKWWIDTHKIDFNIKLIVFKNNKDKCIYNINRNAMRNKEKRLEMIELFGSDYDPIYYKNVVSQIMIKDIFTDKNFGA